MNERMNEQMNEQEKKRANSLKDKLRSTRALCDGRRHTVSSAFMYDN